MNTKYLDGHQNIILEKPDEIAELYIKVSSLERELCILKDLITDLLEKK